MLQLSSFVITLLNRVIGGDVDDRFLPHDPIADTTAAMSCCMTSIIGTSVTVRSASRAAKSTQGLNVASPLRNDFLEAKTGSATD